MIFCFRLFLPFFLFLPPFPVMEIQTLWSISNLLLEGVTRHDCGSFDIHTKRRVCGFGYGSITDIVDKIKLFVFVRSNASWEELGVWIRFG